MELTRAIDSFSTSRPVAGDSTARPEVRAERLGAAKRTAAKV